MVNLTARLKINGKSYLSADASETWSVGYQIKCGRQSPDTAATGWKGIRGRGAAQKLQILKMPSLSSPRIEPRKVTAARVPSLVKLKI
jgi:hypothetical protein